MYVATLFVCALSILFYSANLMIFFFSINLSYFIDNPRPSTHALSPLASPLLPYKDTVIGLHPLISPRRIFTCSYHPTGKIQYLCESQSTPSVSIT